MKRAKLPTPRISIFVEALEPRIAPAGLLNEAKFTPITLGTPQLLDASGGPNTFQGLSTGSGGSGQFLLYITSGKALVFTTDIAGNGKYEPGDITGIAAGVDGNGNPLNLILFTDVHGDIVTDLLPGKGISQLTDSDGIASNGRDGRILLPDGIAGITLRTVTAGDLDPTNPGDTVQNRLALTHFSVYGNIYTGGDFGGLTIDTSGEGQLTTKFAGTSGDELFTAADPTIGGIYTGTAASNQSFHFTQVSPDGAFAGLGSPALQGTIVPFVPSTGAHGGDISNVQAAVSATVFNIGTLETGNGGFGARGGNISNVTLHVNGGAYEVIAGDGGEGAVGATGGSIINFSDVGSVTGDILMHTGSGGVGQLGVGGAGGTATFGAVNVLAGEEIILGHGGNGFTGGGAGAGLPTATFTVPEGGIPLGTQFEGTYHAIGDVGNTHLNAQGNYSPQVIDFNGDGFGDAVYSTSNPDQLVVVFGDGTGNLVDANGFNLNGATTNVTETIRLNTPGAITSFVVADFNGDGRPDIAVASAGTGNYNNIEVFLNQIGNSVVNPLGSGNFTKNPLGAHPFSAPLMSETPTLTDFGFYAGNGGILALTAGDFNGDGIMDLGYVQQVNLIAPAANNPLSEVVGVLFGSPVLNPSTLKVVTNPTTGHLEGSGFFYANPAPQGEGEALQVAFFPEVTATPILQATSLTSNNVPLGSTTGIPNAPEVVFYGEQGADGHAPGQALFLLSVNNGFLPMPIELGQVDTNRNPNAGTTTNVTLADFTFENLTISDLNNDGFADLTVLSKAPVSFLDTIPGSVQENFSTISSGTGGDQAGIYLGGNSSTVVTAIDFNGTGTFNDVGLLTFGGGTSIMEVTVSKNGAMDSANVLATLGVDIQTNQAISALDAFYNTVPVTGTLHPDPGFGVLTPNSTLSGDSYLTVFSDNLNAPYFLYETNNGFRVYGGDGGNSLAGAGGPAGSIGNGTLSAGTNGPAGSVSVVLPAFQAYQGISLLQGGNGGSGFTSGGSGGDVSGVSQEYAALPGLLTSISALHAGNGGNGISGAGGRGGNLSEFTENQGSVFTAGNGGTGLTGGAGGSVIGNTAGVYDTSVQGFDVVVVAGAGATGALAGGMGGSVTNFDSVYTTVPGGFGGALTLASGKGGSTAGGVGGNGGSIINSSPDPTDNNLSGDIAISTGAGGNGLIGGAGGAITTFLNAPTNTAIPAALNILTGNGGIGVSGTGGAGGAITGVQADATGLDFGMVRVLAGEGGASYGATGGAGGSISNATVTATSTPIVVAAGAGGPGLLIGGNGGAVTNSVISSAAQEFGKVLVIAGDGGDSFSVAAASVLIPGDAHPKDLAHALLAFGGANSLGGSGGDITGITQPTGSETAVDLIAGNGGSTINSGSVLQATSGVGQGGSVTDVNLAGTVGAVMRDVTSAAANPPIKSYTDLKGTGVDQVTTAQFVQTYLSGTVPTSQIDPAIDIFTPTAAGIVISDAIGNVGILAGRAGFVKGGQPASDGVNGAVQDVSASSFLSVVAGSVNNVAPVSVISGLTITNSDGVFGADKSLPTSATAGGPNGVLDYINSVGMDVQNLAAGDRLIDGALYALTVEKGAAPPFIAGPRVFGIKNP